MSKLMIKRHKGDFLLDENEAYEEIGRIVQEVGCFRSAVVWAQNIQIKGYGRDIFA